MAESLAVRHRPRRFADVAGQRHVSAVLRSAAARQEPPQQILLAGGSGLGKTTLARIFAAALFCEDRDEDGDACGVCESCRDVTGAGGFHPDVIELDAASNGGKDEIRDIAARASLTPLRAPWKVYIIDEAHGLTGPGGQAFLKLLEEPPAHTIFILATTDPDKLPTAVRGRCTICEVLPPTREEVAANLRRIAELEGWNVDHDVVSAVLDATDPALGMRGTVMTLEKLAGPLAAGHMVSADELETLLGTVAPSRLRALTDAIVAGDRPLALTELIDQSSKVGSSHLRRQLSAWAREQLVDAARRREGFETAFRRYELISSSSEYDGALEVAVTRMADPFLDDPVAAARPLLEQAQQALADSRSSRTAPMPSHGQPVTTTPEQVPTPEPLTTQPSGTATDRTPPASSSLPSTGSSVGSHTAPATPGLPAQVNPTGTEASSHAVPPNAPGEAVELRDPTLVAVLNAVGKQSARAAATLRHCQIQRLPDQSLRIHPGPDQAERAAEVGLADIVKALDEKGLLPVPVTVT